MSLLKTNLLSSPRTPRWPALSPRLRPLRRQGVGGIVWPDMAGIAALHLLLDVVPGAFPKARKIARRLDRAMRGREQLQSHGNAALGERRMAREAEELMHAHREQGAAQRRIVERDA
jgi:hypothetical protein